MKKEDIICETCDDEYATKTGKHYIARYAGMCARGETSEEAVEALLNHLEEMKKLQSNKQYFTKPRG